MERKSISDFYNLSLFIFDLDNTIYNEDNYLFDAYRNISEFIAGKVPALNVDELNLTLRKLYEVEGRSNLFNKFLDVFELDHEYLPDCIQILRSFKAINKYKIYQQAKTVIEELIIRGKSIYVLTNGNPGQQRNKIRNINWEDIEKSLTFVFADELEPKPSPAGIEHILVAAGIEKNKSIMIGDSEIDGDCARNGGIHFIYAEDLFNILNQ